ncbi:MAG: hypothetical protein JRM78_05330 [Nitrososphaerota archaeon]|jgi:hypothetical protein|nr:hypothetical protein [Nitrososphaerota archaeon]MDG7040848.1 hypothetical protein [Nitrososphaerota archaeon]
MALKSYTLVNGRLISDVIMMSKLNRETSRIDKLSEAAYFLEVTRIDDTYKILKLGYSIFWIRLDMKMRYDI